MELEVSAFCETSLVDRFLGSFNNFPERRIKNTKAQLKCPFCLKVKNFRNEIKTNTRFNIPNGSPAYPHKQNFQLGLKCSSNFCSCPGGQFFLKTNTNFDLVGYTNCGSDTIHKKCDGIETDWVYNACDVELNLDTESYDTSFNSKSQTSKKIRLFKKLSSNKKVTDDKIISNVKTPKIPLGRNFVIKLPRLPQVYK